MPPETPTVTFIAMIVRRGELAGEERAQVSASRSPTREPGYTDQTLLWPLGVQVVGVVGLYHHFFEQLRPGRGCCDLAGGDLFLGHAAGLVGAGVDQRLGAVLKLPGAAGCHDHITKIAIKSML